MLCRNDHFYLQKYFGLSIHFLPKKYDKNDTMAHITVDL